MQKRIVFSQPQFDKYVDNQRCTGSFNFTFDITKSTQSNRSSNNSLFCPNRKRSRAQAHVRILWLGGLCLHVQRFQALLLHGLRKEARQHFQVFDFQAEKTFCGCKIQEENQFSICGTINAEIFFFFFKKIMHKSEHCTNTSNLKCVCTGTMWAAQSASACFVQRKPNKQIAGVEEVRAAQVSKQRSGQAKRSGSPCVS